MERHPAYQNSCPINEIRSRTTCRHLSQQMPTTIAYRSSDPCRAPLHRVPMSFRVVPRALFSLKMRRRVWGRQRAPLFLEKRPHFAACPRIFGERELPSDNVDRGGCRRVYSTATCLAEDLVWRRNRAISRAHVVAAWPVRANWVEQIRPGIHQRGGARPRKALRCKGSLWRRRSPPSALCI